MQEEDFSQYVLQDGTLDDSRLIRREVLYHGLNGRAVERIFTDAGTTCIFKPVTNGDSADEEVWIYAHVLNSFPAIVPKLLAHSSPGAGGSGWRIFEDLGQLQHGFSLTAAKEVVKQMAWWHNQPVQAWSGLKTRGQKPPIHEMASSLIERDAELERMLRNLISTSATHDGLELSMLLESSTRRQLIRSFAEADGNDSAALRLQVLSHGDLHLGNYATTKSAQLYILDWEHAHLNSPFWDLVHLIDLSHPMFPKMLHRSEREQLLREYVRYSSFHGRTWDYEQFIIGYCRYAAVFSLWLLLLITADLEQDNPIWPREKLLLQQEEAVANLCGCLARLFMTRSESSTDKNRFRA